MNVRHKRSQLQDALKYHRRRETELHDELDKTRQWIENIELKLSTLDAQEEDRRLED